jgi:NADPH-dependent glutamate synthase beta subunit-like oxidoreductase
LACAATTHDLRNDARAGVLRYGIPSYRLPREILAKEIDYIVPAPACGSNAAALGADPAGGLARAA